jgi:hypothetical protein
MTRVGSQRHSNKKKSLLIRHEEAVIFWNLFVCRLGMLTAKFHFGVIMLHCSFYLSVVSKHAVCSILSSFMWCTQ